MTGGYPTKSMLRNLDIPSLALGVVKIHRGLGGNWKIRFTMPAFPLIRRRNRALFHILKPGLSLHLTVTRDEHAMVFFTWVGPPKGKNVSSETSFC